ncbi:MAG: RsmD family RNA methyltransferase [Candidatus Limnocylindria bacterium]
MRVIAGEAKGRTLVAPRGSATRPASDRIRETLFAILEPRLEGASVLDLFAGAGTLGVEALSRGAARATFVERAPAAAAAIRANLAATRLADRAEVVVADVERYLARAAASPDGAGIAGALPAVRAAGSGTSGFDLVFCDPPFADVAGAEACLAHPGLRAALGAGAQVIVRALRKHLPALPPNVAVLRRRELGEETLLFLGYDGAGGGG